MGLEEGARKWRDQAPPTTRVTIDALVVDRTVLVHFIRADLTGRASRGTIALLAADDRAKAYCSWHPVVEGIKPERDWDVIYDQKQAEREAKRLGLPHPLEALLHHEVMGHVLPVLRDPTLLRRIKRDLRLKRENERYAIQQENEYRKHVGLPLVSEDFSWFVSE